LVLDALGGERKTVALVAIRQCEQTRLTTTLQRKHDAMLDKQRKLDDFEERLEQQGAISSSRARY